MNQPLPFLSMEAFERDTAKCAVRRAHADFIERMTMTTPHRIVVTPDPADFEERADHVREVLEQFKDYLHAITSDTASNMTGSHRAEMARMIDNAMDDLAGDLCGTIRKEADKLREATGAQP